MSVTRINSRNILDSTIDTLDLANGAVTFAKLNSNVPYSAGGLQLDGNGLSAKLPTISGLITDATGLYIKRNGTSGLSMNADGIWVSVDATRGMSITGNGVGLNLLSTGGLGWSSNSLRINATDASILVGSTGIKVQVLSTGGISAGTNISIKLVSTGGMQTDANGLSIKVLSVGGLATDANGLAILLPANSGLYVDANGLVAALEAKGDLLVGTSYHASAKLTAGANWKALCADSVASSGLAYKPTVHHWGSATDNSNDVTNTVTQTDYDNQFTAIPRAWWAAGKSIRIKAWGYLSSSGTPTLQHKVWLYPLAMVDFGAVAVPNNASNLPWRIDVIATCRAAGATGSIEVWYEQEFNGGTRVWSRFLWNANVNFDGYDLVPKISAQWGTANSGNHTIMSGFTCELLEA